MVERPRAQGDPDNFPYADHILSEKRLDADTVVHAHTPNLAAWSLAQKAFPIRYVAPQRFLLAREIPNHLERRRSHSTSSVSVWTSIRISLRPPDCSSQTEAPTSGAAAF